MQLPPHVANALDQRPLNVQMNVFEFSSKLEFTLLNLLANGRQTLLNLSALLGGDKAHSDQHLGMRDRCSYIMRVQSPVKADAFGELLDPAIRRLAEYSRPGFLLHNHSWECAGLVAAKKGQHI